jgi:hypothetical protein
MRDRWTIQDFAMKEG